MIEDHEPERSSRLRAVALGALSLVLAWLVVERSLVAYLAEVAPQAALFLAPNDARALANLADRVYTRRWVDQQRGKPAPQAGANTAADQAGASDGNARLGAWSGLALKAAEKEVPGDDPAAIAGLSEDEIIEKVRGWAEAAVANDPFNARALRVLGQLAADANDKERAALFMRAAADRSHHRAWRFTGCSTTTSNATISPPPSAMPTCCSEHDPKSQVLSSRPWVRSPRRGAPRT
jgi:hypothetical protein